MIIKAEVDAGRLVGPLGKPAGQKVHTSPIGLIPKSQPNQWRVIVDLSFPTMCSVNDAIASDLASITYASVDDAVRLILQLGWGTQLVKLDLKNAYHIVPVHQQDQHLLGISWEGKSYADGALPFGLRSAPKVFSAVADMIAWTLHCAGVQHQIHYLDDFFVSGSTGNRGGRKSPGDCSEGAGTARGPGGLIEDRRSSMLPNIFGDLEAFAACGKDSAA